MVWSPAQGTMPPPGREQLDLDGARSLLVDHAHFAKSGTRPRLWDGLERYLARFLKIEEQYESELAGRSLVPFLWLGGSFVSSEPNPRNIDLTVAIDMRAREVIRGRPGSGWLTSAFQRQTCLVEFCVSPTELPYLPLASVFRSDRLSTVEQRYLRERGAWDDWWQRCRPPGVDKAPPTQETAVPARGYLEVTL